MHWLHTTLGAPEGYADYDAAVTAMNKLIAKLKKEGYTAKPHPQDADRYTLTHASKGFLEVYVHDEGPE